MGEREFEAYTRDSMTYLGKMNIMANSIDLVIGVIFEKTSKKTYKNVRKQNYWIWKTKQILEHLYTGDFDEFVRKLERFNKNWVVTKHGILVGGTQKITIYKDERMYIFDQRKQEEIDDEFTQIMSWLSEITNKIQRIAIDNQIQW